MIKLLIFIFSFFITTHILKADRLNQCIEKVKAKLEKLKIPGASIALIKGDSLIYCGGIGVSDLKKNIQTDQNTQFAVGSISKTIIALGIMKLVDEDKLKLEDNVSNVLSEVLFTNQWEEAFPLKVIHLLEHTSGFDELHVNEFYAVEKINKPSLNEILAVNPSSRQCRWKPGEYFGYSSANYTVLAHIIEKISGMSFEEYIKKNILLPLKMKNSGFDYSECIESGTIKGYLNGNYEEVPKHGLLHYPSIGFVSNVLDMVNLLKFLMGDGSVDSVRIIKSENFKRMFTSETGFALKNGFENGYCKGIYPDVGENIKLYGHRGLQYGFFSEYRISFQNKFGYVIFMNSSNNWSSLYGVGDILYNFLSYGDAKQRIEIKTINSEVMSQFEGYYFPINFTNQKTAIAEMFTNSFVLQGVNDTLTYKTLFSNNLKFLYSGNGRFMLAGGSGTFMNIVKNEEGNMIYSDTWEHAIKVSSVKWWSFWVWIALCASIISFALCYGLFIIFKKMLIKKSNALACKYCYFPVMLIALLSVFLINVQLYELGYSGFKSIALFMFSILIPLFSLTGVFVFIRNWKILNNGLERSFLVLLNFANISICGYLWYWGLLGLMTWNW